MRWLFPGDSKWPFLGWLSDPLKGLSDLQLGDEKVTLNHLVHMISHLLHPIFTAEIGEFLWLFIVSINRIPLQETNATSPMKTPIKFLKRVDFPASYVSFREGKCSKLPNSQNPPIKFLVNTIKMVDFPTSQLQTSKIYALQDFPTASQLPMAKSSSSATARLAASKRNFAERPYFEMFQGNLEGPSGKKKTWKIVG